jgi:hypothetical protein
LRYDSCPNTVDLHRGHVLGGECSSEGFFCGRVDHASHKYPIINRRLLVYIISIDLCLRIGGLVSVKISDVVWTWIIGLASDPLKARKRRIGTWPVLSPTLDRKVNKTTSPPHHVSSSVENTVPSQTGRGRQQIPTDGSWI